MKILVTGGAGFIGSNVVDGYINAGHEVVIMDNLFSGKWENINPKARFYLMDIRSEEVQKVFEKEGFDIVNHHAAQMSVPASVDDPIFDADVNVKGLLNLLEAARKTNVSKVIFISSGGAIYGESEEYPYQETSPAIPLSPAGRNTSSTSSPRGYSTPARSAVSAGGWSSIPRPFSASWRSSTPAV